MQDSVMKYIECWKKYHRFVEFKEPKNIMKYSFQRLEESKNIKPILLGLKEENEYSESTASDIQVLEQRLEELCLFNIDKLKLYCTKSEWDSIEVPIYLKTITLHKIHHCFDDCKDEKEEEMDASLPIIGRNIDPNCTLRDICELLSNSLFTKPERIMPYIHVFMDYKYKTLYHLSQISDELYMELMVNAPKCLKCELFSLITNCRDVMNSKALPFNESKDWTMKTEQIFEILEQDLHFEKGELSQDCDILMNHFYSTLWDWFFIPESIWKTLPYCDTYQIVRVRINDLMTQCLNQYNINNKPMLPQSWLNACNDECSYVEQLLFGELYNTDLQFHFDGMNWNENVMSKVKKIYNYINREEKEAIDTDTSQPLGIIKLESVQEEYAKNSDGWSTFVNDNQIPMHIAFKIVFYCYKGNIASDEWLNLYINNCKYPNFAFKCKQATLLPSFVIENVTDVTAKIVFPRKLPLACRVYISEESKESNWDELVTVDMNEDMYLCKQLKRFTAYKLRAIYKNHPQFTEVTTFKTKHPSPPVFVIDKVAATSATLRFTSQTDLECQIEVLSDSEEHKEAKWNLLTTMRLGNTTLPFLKPNHPYRIRAKYKDGIVYSNYSQTQSFLTLPLRPVFSMQNILATQAILKLSKDTKVMCFVEISDDSPLLNEHWRELTTTQTKGCFCPDLEANHAYKIRAKYKNDSGYSKYSQIMSFTTLPKAPIFSLNYVCDIDTATTASLTLSNWCVFNHLLCEVELLEAGYSDALWIKWGNFAKNTFLCTQLKDNYSYQLRLRYTNETGFGQYSKIVSFSTSPLPPVFSIQNIGTQTAKIVLSKKTQMKCEIELVPSVNQYTHAMIPADATEYLCNNLQSNCCYQIRAKYKKKNSIESVYSKHISFTTLPIPPCISIDRVTHNSCSLIFSKTKSAQLNCIVEIASKSQNYHSASNWTPYPSFRNKKKYVCTNLRWNNLYEIRAKYENKTGFSHYSKVGSFKTKMLNPPKFSVGNITATTATLTFSSIRTDLVCCVQIVNCYGHPFAWTDLATFSKKKTFLCTSLQRDSLYQVRVKYKSGNKFSNSVEFGTMDWTDILTKKEGKKLKQLINDHTRNEFKKKWKLLYRGSEHGFTSDKFYEKCNMTPNTICIVKTAETDNVFGAYTSNAWDKSKVKDRSFETDGKAFMYLVRSSKGLKPKVFPVSGRRRNVIGYKQGSFLRFGPNNGANGRIILADNCNIQKKSIAWVFSKQSNDILFSVPNGYKLFDGKKFTVKEVEVYQLYQKVRKHNGGTRNKFRKELIENWNTDDVCHWISTIKQISDEWYYKILAGIQEHKVIGADITDLESVKDIGFAFDISTNQKLCKKLFQQIQRYVQMSTENAQSNPNQMFGGPMEEDTFRINIFSQEKHIELKEEVTKTTKVSYVKKMFKRQTGVSASINDILFYSKRKLMQSNKTLEQCNITDDRHLISVQFHAADGKGNNDSWANSFL